MARAWTASLLVLCAARAAAGLPGGGRALLAAVFTPEDVREINALDLAFFGLADSPECESWKVRRPGGRAAPPPPVVHSSRGAPATFSTTAVCPKERLMVSAMIRAARSVGPPGGKGTTMRMGLDG